MPYLEVTLEEADANDCSADCTTRKAACCAPAEGAADSAAKKVGKASLLTGNAEGSSDWSGLPPLGNWVSFLAFSGRVGGFSEFAEFYVGTRILCQQS